MLRPQSFAAGLGLVCAASCAVLAQEAAQPSPSTPLKIQVVLTRYAGEQKLATMPYTLLVNAGDRDNRVALRMGVSVPLATTGKDGPTVTFHDIGTNMDCTATPADNGRFRVKVDINHSAVYELEGRSGGPDQRRLQPAVPRPGDNAQLIRSFTSASTLLLRNGETGQSIAATDPVTGEVMKIDVTLSVLK
ncbi:MAG: hypothetical protein U0Q12_14405 [Vicinamibacterales bacterium]